MRVLTCLVAVGLAAGTTGCIEMMDSGYGNSGYNNSGYGNSGYSYGSSPYAASPYYSGSSGYRQPVTNNYYTTYQPQPQVITQTRYVPVPTAAPAQIQRTPSRWEGRRNRDTNATTPTNNQQPNQQTNRRRDRDRDNDGIPDRQERREERRTDRNS